MAASHIGYLSKMHFYCRTNPINNLEDRRRFVKLKDNNQTKFFYICCNYTEATADYYVNKIEFKIL